MYRRYIAAYVGFAFLVVFTGATGAAGGNGLEQARVCLSFPVLLLLTLLPAEAVTTALTERLGLHKDRGGG